MTANLYCSRQDVNRRLPLGAIVSPSGIVASCSATTNAIEFDGHGLETDDAVTVRAVDGGVLSAPLVAGDVYYVMRLTTSSFQLARGPACSAIDITTAGVSMVVTREPIYDEVIEFYSRWADGCLPAHAVPFTGTIPALVKGVVADLSAKKLLNIGGQDSAILATAELASKAMLERLAPGIPLRDVNAISATNCAITSADLSADPRGWGSGTLP